jgi:hypothetical protein
MRAVRQFPLTINGRGFIADHQIEKGVNQNARENRSVFKGLTGWEKFIKIHPNADMEPRVNFGQRSEVKQEEGI